MISSTESVGEYLPGCSHPCVLMLLYGPRFWTWPSPWLWFWVVLPYIPDAGLEPYGGFTGYIASVPGRPRCPLLPADSAAGRLKDDMDPEG
jgi:hypothetical protein